MFHLFLRKKKKKNLTSRCMFRTEKKITTTTTNQSSINMHQNLKQTKKHTILNVRLAVYMKTLLKHIEIMKIYNNNQKCSTLSSFVEMSEAHL